MVLQHLKRTTKSNTRKEIIDNDDEITALAKRVMQLEGRVNKISKITEIAE